MTITLQPLTAAQVQTMLAWTYEAPYAIYNLNGDDPQEAQRFFLDPANGYFALVAGDNLLGFCNFGADAQVPGGDYTLEALDIGMGLRPDLTGKGQGARYASAVFAFASNRFPDLPLRVTIAAFNERAQRLCAKFGFQISQHFMRTSDSRPFVIMSRPPLDGSDTGDRPESF